MCSPREQRGRLGRRWGCDVMRFGGCGGSCMVEGENENENKHEHENDNDNRRCRPAPIPHIYTQLVYLPASHYLPPPLAKPPTPARLPPRSTRIPTYLEPAEVCMPARLARQARRLFGRVLG